VSTLCLTGRAAESTAVSVAIGGGTAQGEDAEYSVAISDVAASAVAASAAALVSDLVAPAAASDSASVSPAALAAIVAGAIAATVAALDGEGALIFLPMLMRGGSTYFPAPSLVP
jgi:hypothetical protein